MNNSVFEQIHSYTKYLDLDLGAQEIARFSEDQALSDAQLQAIASVFSYSQRQERRKHRGNAPSDEPSSDEGTEDL